MSLWLTKGPPFVAEIGGNHGGDARLAAQMVESAAKLGFGGVKFQAYRTENFIHQSSPYYDELKREELSFDELGELGRLAKKLSLAFGLTIFDLEGLGLAQGLGCDFIKISSGDLTYLPLIREAAKAKSPLVISTGASTQAEVDKALAITGPRAIVLQCASLYPAPEGAVNLAVLDSWLRKGLRAGLSDHSLTLEPMKWAYFLGAELIEKHFTIDRSLPGGDNQMSMDPSGMAQLMSEIKELNGLGAPKNHDRPNLAKTLRNEPFWCDGAKTPQVGENPNLIRRYALASTRIKKGEKLSLKNLVFKRLSPQMITEGQGILTPDRDFENLKAKSDLAANEPIFLSAITD
ncbi:MAG: N-acetylneuraminate synthase family protein [Deltaproteobacteria bacterium]|nr:N-acetylneuraminate synthase family protein [Deltaproteobacteria bacterium]